jgi:hypothetical protein
MFAVSKLLTSLASVTEGRPLRAKVVGIHDETLGATDALGGQRT